MGFKNFHLQIVIRVALLTTVVFLFVNLFYSESYTFTKFLLGILLTYQIYNIFQFLEKSNRQVIGFLKTIQYEDFSHTYPDRKTGSSMDDLYPWNVGRRP